MKKRIRNSEQIKNRGIRLRIKEIRMRKNAGRKRRTKKL